MDIQNKHLYAPDLTDEVILEAFAGTNFGRTDYRDFLANSVLKKACGWYCGHTITCIMVNLKLITPKTHKVTKLGKLFLTDSYPDTSREARAAPPVPFSHAASDVIAERQRQVSSEGWTPEHDDQHTSGELAGAAACYARHVNGRQWIYPINPYSYAGEEAPHEWPWDEAWWKPKSPRRDLVRAAALILAEIERLDRAAGGSVADE